MTRMLTTIAVSATLLLASNAYTAGFTKPSPETWEQATKLRASDGSVFRTAREDWDAAKQRVAQDPAWRAWLDARRDALDAWIARHPGDHSEWPGGRPHGFVSPKDSSTLTWTDAIPGKETDHFFSPSDPRVPLTPENTASWFAEFRNRHANKIEDAAFLYRLTGHQPYADWVAGQLDYYAANLRRWATIRPGGPRLCYEDLGDAVLLSKFVASARLVFDITPADRRQAWLDGLFRPTVERLDRTWQVIQNHSVWHRASAAQVGLLYGDDAMLRRALDAEFGLRAQLRQGVTSDYIWFEQSMSYNTYVIHAVRPLLELACLLGQREALREEAAIIQNLAIAPFLIRFPDGNFPNPSDAGVPQRVAKVTEDRLAELYRILPTAPGLASAARSSRRTWDTLLDPPSAVRAEYATAANLNANFPPVVTRSLESTRFAVLKSGRWQVFFHYGQLSKFHAQDEALNWSANFDGIDITHDTGTSNYGSQMYKNYYARGLGHNVPLINGEGQKPWHPGTLIALDSDPGSSRVSAEQPQYRPDTCARRTLRIEDDTLTDEITVTNRTAARLGFALHLQGTPRLTAGFATISKADFTRGRPAPFGYWRDVRSATFEDLAEFPVTFSNKKTLVVRISTPGRFTVYAGASPDTPPTTYRTGLYIEKEEATTSAAFTTALAPANAPYDASTKPAKFTKEETRPIILIRSGWQTANIGDIAHTSGILTLLKKHIPSARCILWPVDISGDVEPMLRRHFPSIEIVRGNLNTDGIPDSPELQAAFDKADMFICASTADISTGTKMFSAWKKYHAPNLQKHPYGFYGVTVDRESTFSKITRVGPLTQTERDILNSAAFVYMRETTSLEFLNREKIAAPVLAFVPDVVFGVDQYDDAKATAWLGEKHLQKDGYICVIVRTRFAPYYKMHNRPPTEIDLARENYNALHIENDMGKIREAIIQWVEKTGLKVVLCPEMTFEIEVSKNEIFDKLPADIRRNVVWKDSYWMPDEAASVYRNAITLLSMDCHSPIIATTVGTPSIYLPTATETSKGQMWPDIGLGDWVMNLDDSTTTGETIAAKLIDIHTQKTKSQEKIDQAMRYVHSIQEQTLTSLSKLLEKH